jgi:hypothetical protein
VDKQKKAIDCATGGENRRENDERQRIIKPHSAHADVHYNINCYENNIVGKGLQDYFCPSHKNHLSGRSVARLAAAAATFPAASAASPRAPAA